VSIKPDFPSAPEPLTQRQSLATELLWAVLGLLLTIFSTFVEVFATNPPWEWFDQGIYVHSLGITYQIGAVLLTACLGGPNAGAFAQCGYLLLGMTWLPILASGEGWNTWQQPTFGYLLGFIPGAWVCGYFAFRQRAAIETLAWSSLLGLGTIHLCGILYLFFLTLLKIGNPPLLPLTSLGAVLHTLSWGVLPAQIILVCLTAVLAYLLRRILFI
jgi:biotin transport system substrate-specific component